jgi:hypothetical protein
MHRDVIIIGAGAAGLLCAIQAGKRGRRVTLIEHAEKPGKKILISGGGRCNFTNLHTAPENFISQNPNFIRSALARYTPHDFIQLVERHGIHYHEKKLGQLFCDGSSREIVSMLTNESHAAGVEIKTHCTVTKVEKKDVWKITTNQGEFSAESLVVATGGLSIPKMGATDFGHRLARQFGLKVTQLRPALVPLTLPTREREMLGALSGVSVPAIASCNGAEFEENILVTHRGLSGPAILQISSYWNGRDAISFRLMPGVAIDELLQARKDDQAELATVLGEHLPHRFARAWCNLYATSKPMHHLSAKELRRIADLLMNWQVRPDGTEGFAKAEVTLGGVDTDELSSKTMEARRAPGLYFIGEVVDVTGWLGGYNFQWAWASGFAAGQYV